MSIVYLVADELRTGSVVFGETTIPTYGDMTEADAAAALLECVGKPVRVIGMDTETLRTWDASAAVARYLADERHARGEEPLTGAIGDFIWRHAPADVDVGYRGPINDFSDSYAHLRAAAE
jgi:hypothetical protein